MTQFRIDVVVDPRKAAAGSKTVQRELTSVEKKANKTQLAIQKALAFVGVGFAVRQLAEIGDAFTNLQNRLRVVTDSQRELISATEDLLQVSNRSRSSFESTAELYSRLALATRELNLEGANLVEITESINKAIILSGASAKEANNGLIQLSQGLASGRLTGDELRSTLEQLPVVADVIAKELGVTRGELRKLGAEGKITSIQIIRAFQNAQEEIEQNFANTVPTLSQSFVVLRNNVVAFVGRINEGTGVLRGFGAAIRFVGEELETIVKTLTLVGVAAGAIKLAPAIQSFFALQGAVEAVTVARAKSTATINLQNKLIAEQARANVVAAAAELKRTDGIILQARFESLNNAIKKGGNALLFEKAAVTRQLAAVEAQRTTQLAALVAAEKASAAANLAAGKNVTVFSRAMDTASASVKRLTAAIAANPVGIFVVALSTLVAGLVIFRKEIKLTEDGVATLNDLFGEFFNQLGIALSVIGDQFRSAFGPAIDAVREVVGVVEFEFADLIRVPALFVDRFIGLFLGLARAIPAIFSSLPDAIGDVFVRIVNGAITTLEFIPDVIIGILRTLGQTLSIFINGQISAFSLLGASAKQALVGNFEAAAQLAEQAAQASKTAFTTATEGLGSRFLNNIAQEVDDELIPRLDNTFTGGFAELGTRALDAFVEGATFSGVRDFVNGLISGAENTAQDRASEEATKAKAEADKQAATAAAERAAAVQKVIGPLVAENKLLSESINLGTREAQIRETLRGVTDKLAESGIKLSFAQNLFVQGLVRQNAAMEENLATAERLQTVQEKLDERTRLATQAFVAGAISAEQYSTELRNIAIASAEAGDTMADGMVTGIERIRDELNDLASTVDSILVDGFNGALDGLGTAFEETFSFIANNLADGETSWTDYRDAIKATFKSAVDGILKDLARLLAQKALLALFGGGGGGGFGGVLSSLVAGERAEGGLTTANKPFLVGEEGPEIFTPGQTGSITPTDQTISALSNGAANNRETVVVQAPTPEVNVQTIVVDDPSKVPTGIESPDGRQAVRNVIREERAGIKRDLA